MVLDKFTDYGLRLLVSLAVAPDARLSVTAIADSHGLSAHHLSKVASALVREGFVSSERGRTGGLSLARPAQAVSIGAVVRALRGDAPVVECFGPDQTCRILPACGLRGPLQTAQEAFFAALDPVTLADVTGKKTVLAQLLNGERRV